MNNKKKEKKSRAIKETRRENNRRFQILGDTLKTRMYKYLPGICM